MSNRVKFICQKFPELVMVIVPDTFVESGSGRSKSVKGERIEFRRNPYGVGEFVTDDAKKESFIRKSAYFLQGYIVVAENENDPRLREKGSPRIVVSQGLRSSRQEGEQGHAAPPEPEAPETRSARVPPKRAKQEA